VVTVYGINYSVNKKIADEEASLKVLFYTCHESILKNEPDKTDDGVIKACVRVIDLEEKATF